MLKSVKDVHFIMLIRKDLLQNDKTCPKIRFLMMLLCTDNDFGND